MRRLSVVSLCLPLLACDLTEVILNPGDRTVVVQSVLNRDHADQFVVLEYSFNGDTTGRVAGRRVIPPGRPQFPITGASVRMTYPGPGPCNGRLDTLAERPATGNPPAPSGIYGGVPCRLQPGERARLEVITMNGEVVTAETVMPGISNPKITSSQGSFGGDTLVPLFRERDTLRIDLGASLGRGVQVEARTSENPDDLVLYLFNDSLGISVAGNVVNPFNHDGTFVFHSGHFYQLALVLGDTNYFDYVRSISDPITGRGYLNHVKGGLGVFGSVDVQDYVLRVAGNQTDPREGTYRILGRVNGADIDLKYDFYFDRDPGYTGTDEPISGFVRGSVFEGAIDQSGDGLFGSAPGITSSPQALQFAFQFTRVVPTNPPSAARFRRYEVTAVRTTAQGTTFQATVTVRGQSGQTISRSTNMTMVQTVGPVSLSPVRP